MMAAQFPTRTVRVTIDETAEGWRVSDGSAPFETATAGEALAAVKASSEARARASGISEVLVLTWEPKTGLGRVIVRALTGGGA